MASYLIVGGGMTAHAAAKGIREVDASGPITLLAGEPHPPYARPPLSKALWKGDPEEKVWLGDLPGVSVRTKTMAVRIDREKQRVHDDNGAEHPYDALLLATGGTPR